MVRESLGPPPPREPRIYLSNDSQGAFRDRVIRSSCGDLPLPELPEGQVIRLDLVPRPGCKYQIHGDTLTGDDLIRLLDMARDERVDVQITVDIDRVVADLSPGH